MKIKLLIFSMLSSFFASTQIEISSETTAPGKPLRKGWDYSTEVFVLSNFSITNRSLVENVGLFGDTLGIRADEQKLNAWSFGLGLRNKITESVAWEGGISILRNGESYLFEATDTLSSYETRYTYIGMPLKVNYLIGNKVQFIAAAGIIPQMFMRYSQVGMNEDSEGTETDFEFKTRSGYNSFVLSGVLNVGVQLQLSDRMKFFFIPEFRYQFTSSYTDKDPYIHKGRAIGANFGLTVGL
jgi:hypothetical protein